MSQKKIWSMRVDVEDLERARELGLKLGPPIRNYIKLLVWKHSSKAKIGKTKKWQVSKK